MSDLLADLRQQGEYKILIIKALRNLAFGHNLSRTQRQAIVLAANSMLRRLEDGQLLLLGDLPPGDFALLLGFYDFLNLLQSLRELTGYGLSIGT